jgi:fimbrial chaperone protein
MKPILALVTLILAASIDATATPSAAGVRAEPILLEFNAPRIAGIMTLRNDEDIPVTVQTRVFRWVQDHGDERLEPAAEVAASPPIVTLAPGADYTVRVVRTAGTPVHAEESYRLFVDELPDSQKQSQSGIRVLVRQSIPVFFRARQLTRPQVAWSLRQDGDRLLITAQNLGDERLRVASLSLRDSAGRTAAFGNGLVGYVLGQSAMTFVYRGPPHDFGHGGPISISAVSNVGAVNATAPLQTGP